VLGAVLTSVVLGLVILFALKHSHPVSTTKHSINPMADLVVGAIFVLVAVVLGAGRDKPVRDAEPCARPERTGRRRRAWQQALGKGNPKITFAGEGGVSQGVVHRREGADVRRVRGAGGEHHAGRPAPRRWRPAQQGKQGQGGGHQRRPECCAGPRLADPST
jgi:hypothetical protein